MAFLEHMAEVRATVAAANLTSGPNNYMWFSVGVEALGVSVPTLVLELAPSRIQWMTACFAGEVTRFWKTPAKFTAAISILFFFEFYGVSLLLSGGFM